MPPRSLTRKGSINITRYPACPTCRSSKHACARKSAKDRCKGCNHRLKQGGTMANNNCQLAYPEKVIDEHLYDSGWQRPPLEMQDADITTLDLDISTVAEPFTPSRKVEISFSFAGPLNSQNLQVVSAFDTHVLQNFCAKMRDKTEDSNLILKAVLAGGYLHLACSSCDKDFRVQTRTFEKGYPVPNGPAEESIRLSFRHLLMSRVGQLINDVMKAIRSSSSLVDSTQSALLAYSAAAILHVEVEFFKSSLRNGPLSGLVDSTFTSRAIPVGLNGPFVDWLSSIESKLREHLTGGCGDFSNWRSVIHGSLKNLRRHHESLVIFMHLQRNKITPQDLENAVLSQQSNFNVSDERFLMDPAPLPGSSQHATATVAVPLSTSSAADLAHLDSSPSMASSTEYGFMPQAIDQYTDPPTFETVFGEALSWTPDVLFEAFPNKDQISTQVAIDSQESHIFRSSDQESYIDPDLLSPSHFNVQQYHHTRLAEPTQSFASEV